MVWGWVTSESVTAIDEFIDIMYLMLTSSNENGITPSMAQWQ